MKIDQDTYKSKSDFRQGRKLNSRHNSKYK